MFDEKKKKKFHPGTLFEAGSSDSKSDALPAELKHKGSIRQKITTTYLERSDFVL